MSQSTTSRFPIKYLPDGRAMLNLGCGKRMHWQWNNLDFSYYTRLARRRGAAEVLWRVGLLSDDRNGILRQIDPDIISWDLANGVPFADQTFDVVYHSHVLEHIEREAAPIFLRECHRVLKRNGRIRVVVPDLEQLFCAYGRSMDKVKSGAAASTSEHEQAIADIFEQMVRREPAGTGVQGSVVRTLERLVRGDATRAGEAHRWMYDAYSLTRLLGAVGFCQVRIEGPTSSQIEGWRDFGLDTDASSTPFHPQSLYIEASTGSGQSESRR